MNYFWIMKSLRAAVYACLIMGGIELGAQEAAMQPISIAELAANKKDWPREVTLKKEINMTVMINGIPSGFLVISAGRKVQLADIRGEKLFVTSLSAEALIPHTDTDIMEIANSQVGELRRRTARQALIDASMALQTGPPEDSSPALKNDFKALSDEFNDASTIKDWKRVYETEQTLADQLERIAISDSDDSRMLMIPHSSVWYNDYRGELTYKEVSGDFIVTTELKVTPRKEDGAPKSAFSLAGLVIRTPRVVTSESWKPGGENHVILSIGSATKPSIFQYDMRTTANSKTDYVVRDGVSRAGLRIARIGPHIIMLKRTPGGSWEILRRYHRPDMPATLQVGLTAFTDWDTCKLMDAKTHNQTLIKSGNPDVVAAFDYIRFKPVQLPPDLKGLHLSDEARVLDSRLLKVLGDNIR